MEIVRRVVRRESRRRSRDWYFVRGGNEEQQTEEPVSSDRQNSLYEPVGGAHGSFDDRSIDFSSQLWANKHRGALALAGLSAASGLAWIWKRDRGEK